MLYYISVLNNRYKIKHNPFPNVYFYLITNEFSNVIPYKMNSILFYTTSQQFSMIFYTFFLLWSRKVDLTVLDRIKFLCDRKGISVTELSIKMGWSEKAIYSWKNSTPSADKVKSIAEYFGVSIDYLLGRTDNPKVADLDDSDFLVAAHIDEDLTEEELEDIKKYIEFIKSKHKKQ